MLRTHIPAYKNDQRQIPYDFTYVLESKKKREKTKQTNKQKQTHRCKEQTGRGWERELRLTVVISM